jgi:hypothetical protein
MVAWRGSCASGCSLIVCFYAACGSLSCMPPLPLSEYDQPTPVANHGHVAWCTLHSAGRVVCVRTGLRLSTTRAQAQVSRRSRSARSHLGTSVPSPPCSARGCPLQLCSGWRRRVGQASSDKSPIFAGFALNFVLLGRGVLEEVSA